MIITSPRRRLGCRKGARGAFISLTVGVLEKVQLAAPNKGAPRLFAICLSGAFFRPAAAQSAPANTNNVVGSLEESGGGGEQLVYVSNRSSQAIIVTSVRLSDCENVQGSCGAHRMKTRINPGSRVVVQRIRPRFPDKGIGFRYTFTWEVEAAEGPTAKDVPEIRRP